MDSSSPQLPSIDAMLARLLADEFDAGEWDRLQDLLLADPAVRRKYIDLTTLDALLYWEGRGASDLAALRPVDGVLLDSPGVAPATPVKTR